MNYAIRVHVLKQKFNPRHLAMVPLTMMRILYFYVRSRNLKFCENLTCFFVHRVNCRVMEIQNPNRKRHFWVLLIYINVFSFKI